MGRFLRFLLLLAALALIGAVGYVAVIDIAAPQREIVEKVPDDVLFPND